MVLGFVQGLGAKKKGPAMRIAYVNGRYRPHAEALVHVEDRGYQFADGVYEVTAIWNGRPVDLEGHWDRLERSMRALSIAPPMPRRALTVVAREVVRRNRLRNGILYIQVTRGVAPRNHLFPDGDLPSSLVMTARHGRGPGAGLPADEGVRLSTQPDIRWGRCDIKTVGLLPNVLAKQAAREAGAFEALLVAPDGTVTEGTAVNVWIVSADNRLVTRPLGPDILAGITRQRLSALAAAAGLTVEERAFTRDEALAAREVLITSTTSFCLPVIAIDDHPIGDGRPGPTARTLQARFRAFLDTLEGPVWYGA